MVLAAVVLLFLPVSSGRIGDAVSPASTVLVNLVPIDLATFQRPQDRAPDAPGDRDVVLTRRALRLGDTIVDVVISDRPGSKYLFCNLHDDENTAVEAGLEALRKLKGRLVELRHGGKRDITFRLDGETFAVDPNRIFTTAGVHDTLAKRSRRTATAERAVEGFAQSLLDVYSIERTDAVIALHNNSEGHYSALSYAKGGELASDAAAVFIKDGNDPDDFFFVTETAVFDALRRRGHNVVLQDNHRVTDDGSLSVYCGRANVRYINVEAQHGHLERQVAMILAADEVLREFAPKLATKCALPLNGSPTTTHRIIIKR
jgi:hypothetical protein